MTRTRTTTTKKKGAKAHKDNVTAAKLATDLSEGLTVDRILASAQHVLITHGYAGFTTRRVAEAAKISPGNLTYHFPAKRELLRALVAQLVMHYANQFETLLANAHIPPGEALAGLVQWLLADNLEEDNVRLFRELWALSLHDKVVRNAIDDLYDELMEYVFQKIRRVRPDADEASLRELIQMLGIMSEGVIVLYGTRRERAVAYERIISLTTSLLRYIAPELDTSITDDESKRC